MNIMITLSPKEFDSLRKNEVFHEGFLYFLCSDSSRVNCSLFLLVKDHSDITSTIIEFLRFSL